MMQLQLQFSAFVIHLAFGCGALAVVGSSRKASSATSIRIHLDHSRITHDAFAFRRRRRSIATASCEDECRRIPNDGLQIPLGGHTPPWQLNRTAVCKSQTVSDAIRVARSFPIPGMPELTVSNITNALMELGCPVYVKGGAVRDALLGVNPKDIDIVTQCNPSTVRDVCNLLTSNSTKICHGPSSKNVVAFGHREAETAGTKSLDAAADEGFYSGDPNDLEYTPNSLLYDYVNDIVIDLVEGIAVKHACRKQIGIPPPFAQWDDWSNANVIFRYWKLRAKGFQPLNAMVRSYILSRAKEYFSVVDDVETGENYFFSSSYCIRVLGGNYNRSSSTPCSRCQTSLDKDAKIWDGLFDDDLENLWTRNLSKQLPRLKESCVASVIITDLCDSAEWLYFNRTCFWGDPTARGNFFAAQEICSAKGTGINVASVHSSEEEEFLQQISGNKEIWSSIVQTAHTHAEDGWHWLDHSPVDYVNWASSYPKTGHECAYLSIAPSTSPTPAGSTRILQPDPWYSTACEPSSYAYACRQPAKDAPFHPTTNLFYSYHCLPGWHNYNGSCYYHSTDAKDHFGALIYCREQQATLVSIRDQAELSRVNFLRNGDSIWVGMQSADSDHNANTSSWRWEGDMSSVEPGLWDTGYPVENRDRHCGYISAESIGKLRNTACTGNFTFICRKRASFWSL